MIPLFDMMMQAQNGRAMDVMAQQFGLAQEQMAKATAALMPAFSAGLKTNAANPYDFGTFLASMSSGGYAKYFEDMTKAFTPQGLADGQAALGQIFGSKDMSGAVAAQAAQLTGIGQDIYRQMLPVVASAIMGGLFKQATGQMSAPPSFGDNPFGPAMQTWLETIGLARKKEPPAMPNPFDNPFTQAMQAFFTPPKSPEKPQAAPDMFAGNPFMKAFQDMMSMASPQAPGQGQGQAKPADAPPAPKAPVVDMFNTMFDSGIEAQKEYQKAIDGLFKPFQPKS
ncbi:hypothetical protein C8J35_102627 [Rhizobium sp. PP-F2F-G38]|nr:hypothetical protein C8J37_102627 [Rhizobium sp. PP-WC-1G-195]PYE99736.1 hypothetical protein C8J35_102627 [Rhizobium sp. PP-F2F-G38]